MKLAFEEWNGATIVRAVPESDEEARFLQLMIDKKPVVQGFSRPTGKIEEALINFIPRQ